MKTEKPEAAEGRKTAGRKPGTQNQGSLPWQLQQLPIGGALLMPDGRNRAQQLGTAILRAGADAGGKFTLQACGGIPLTAPEGSSFRFYRIIRIA